MPTVIIQQGQSLMDISIQKCGSATALFQLALLNGFSVTQDVPVGTEVLLPAVVNAGIAQYFEDKGIVPATAEAAAKKFEQLQKGGINYMQVGVDFRVS
jgi:hypothetical protein